MIGSAPLPEYSRQGVYVSYPPTKGLRQSQIDAVKLDKRSVDRIAVKIVAGYMPPIARKHKHPFVNTLLSNGLAQLGFQCQTQGFA